MKTVFANNSDCIHAFAQRKQEHGRSSSRNVFFNGNRLYSYGQHFVLAEFLSGNTVLINDTRYSVSTSKHQSIARFALSQYRQIFESSHNVNLVLSSLKELEEKTTKARKPEKYIAEALALIEAHKEAQKIHKTYKSKEQAKELKKLEAFFNTNLEELKPAIEKRRKAEAQKRKRYQKQFEKAFFNFDPFFELRIKAQTQIHLVRLSKCGQYLETSQSVKVPTSEAIALLRAYKVKDITGAKIDGYTISSINEKFVKIGCHTLEIAQIEETLNRGTT